MDKIIDTLPVSMIWFVFLLMPFLAIAGGLGFVPAGVLLGLAGLIALSARREIKSLLMAPWFWALSALIIWCCIAQLWSPYQSPNPPGSAVKLGLIVFSYCGIVTTFKTLKPDTVHMFRHVFMAGGIFATVLMFIEILSGFGLSILVDPVRADEIIHIRQGDAEQNLGRGILVYVQFLPVLIPLLLTQIKRGWVLAVLTVLILILTAQLNRLSLTSYVILAVLIVMMITWKFPKFGLVMTFIGTIGLIVGAPLIGILASQLSADQLSQIPLSLEHRLRMWVYVWERIAENPWLGNGFDVSRTYQDTFLARDGREIVIVSLHPHSSGLHVWLETGAIGAVLAALIVALLFKPALQFATSPIRASALAGIIVAVALFGSTTIGVWQFWWWGSIFVAIGALYLLPSATSADVSIHDTEHLRHDPLT